MARQLAAAGAEVAIIARRESELTRLAAEHPGKLRPYVHDVSNVDEVPALFERIECDLGAVDGLIYAAGVMPKVDESEYDFTKDRAMVTVNLLGAMAWMNQAAARFEAARSGTILGLSSIAGERGRRGNPAYCTSKAALTTYLEALRNRCSRYGGERRHHQTGLRRHRHDPRLEGPVLAHFCRKSRRVVAGGRTPRQQRVRLSCPRAGRSWHSSCVACRRSFSAS